MLETFSLWLEFKHLFYYIGFIFRVHNENDPVSYLVR